jgi:hypothetical protein
MRGRRSTLIIASGALLLFLAGGACSGDDGSVVNTTEGPSPTPFSLGSTLTIRDQEVTLPSGVTYANMSPECQHESTALTSDCVNDSKVLIRGKSYILFEPSTPRVIARRIEPEDESDFRPLLGLIAGTTGGESPLTPSPAQ